MSKETRLKIEKIFDFLGEFVAFFGIIIFALVIINYNFHFLPDTVAAVLEIVKTYLFVVLLAVEGMEAVIKRNIVIRIIFYALLALVIIFLCFPGTYQTMVSMVK